MTQDFAMLTQLLSGYLYPILAIFGVFILFLIVRTSNLIVFIANEEVGIVEKAWSLKGSVDSGFMALNGSAGFQPDILRGGIHFMIPFQYRVHRQPLVTVPQGSVGYVFARDGVPLQPGQTLAGNGKTADFEDVRAFLSKGGQRGPQRTLLREGVYAINTVQFVVFTKDRFYAVELKDDANTIATMGKIISERKGYDPIIIRDHDDLIGVVTVHDGPALDRDEIIAPIVGTDTSNAATYHNNFQDADRFLAAGGRRGRQEQVLVEGTYIVNRLFATVEMLAKTIVNVGHVGVVISYTGPRGDDLSGKEYRHGELVGLGERGVWGIPLQPGKYALNPYAVKVIEVPTTNFVLRWIRERQEEHGFDSKLSEIKLITRDAFEPILPLSIVMHIACEAAPRVIQQFGDVKLLVEQTLDPMVGAYFKDTAQTRTLIELINKRAEIQAEAIVAMRSRFEKYNLDLMEVMIGTPRPQETDQHIATILEQLRTRQVAEEQVVTYENQRKAADKERALREAEAAARNQTQLTQSEIAIKIAENEGRAELARREQDAQSIRITARANADRTVAEGEAEANRIRNVGEAQAAATKAQVAAFGGPEYQLTKEIVALLNGAIRESKVPLVPQVSLGGDGKPGTIVDALLSLLFLRGGVLDPAATPKLDREKQNA